MSQNIIETIIGSVVIIIAATFFYTAYKSTDMRHDSEGYIIVAKFERADGLNLGSDVKIGGIKIGKIVEQKIDNKSFKAVIKMSINKDIQLPEDSSAEIVGNGLLGEKYISLIPGADDVTLKENGVIEFTQSAISLESLIGKFIFNSASSSSTPATPNAESQAPSIK